MKHMFLLKKYISFQNIKMHEAEIGENNGNVETRWFIYFLKHCQVSKVYRF